MIPIIYTLVALVLYSSLNVVLETKLKVLPTHHVTFTLYLAGAILLGTRVIPELWQDYSGIMMRTKPVIFMLICTSIGWIIADYLYVNAYTRGGNVYILTPIAGLIPVISSVLKMIATDTRPTWQQTVACVLAVSAVCLVTFSPDNTAE